MHEVISAITTGQGSTFEELTEQTTPLAVEITHYTKPSSMTSSSSRGVGLYFECAVLVVGVVGMASNALVLYAMVASKQHKKQVLIFNQNLLDVVSCFLLSAMYVAILCDINLTGRGGYWLCLMLLSGGNWWGPYMGSVINLSAINIERYLKVVHPVCAKKKLRNWMIYMTIVFAWVGGSAASVAVNSSTTNVVNGKCLPRTFWASQASRTAFGLWYILSFYVIILLIFIFCYWRILVVIRRQASVMASYSAAGPVSVPNHLKQIQINIVKTMLLVSVLFAITLAPASTYAFLNNVYNVRPGINVLYAVHFSGFLYIVINPFIYATKFDPVRCILKRLIPCNKTTEYTESIEMN